MSDILYFILNGGGWALKPILEKMSVDKIGFFYFSFFRYLVSGIIAIPFIYYQYQKHGLPKGHVLGSYCKYNRHSRYYGKLLLIRKI